jgi:hypothetical protein
LQINDDSKRENFYAHLCKKGEREEREKQFSLNRVSSENEEFSQSKWEKIEREREREKFSVFLLCSIWNRSVHSVSQFSVGRSKGGFC